MDQVSLFKNLPIELRYIITNYNHRIIFILPESELIKYDWFKLIKMNFSLTYEKDKYTNEEIMRIYYYKCCKSKIIPGTTHTIIKLADRTFIDYGDDLHVKPSRNNMSPIISTQINLIPNISEIAHGREYAIIRLKNGTIMRVAYNSFGKLAVENHYERFVFKELNEIKNVKKIVCGSYHTLILLTDGRLLAHGDNRDGQLGLEEYFFVRNIFKEIIGLPNAVSKVVCGKNYTIIMLIDGTLMSTGSNTYGQLGLGKNDMTITFREIKGIPKNIAKITCGKYHTFILLLDGRLMSCGSNKYGQLALSDYKNRNTFTEIIVRKNIVDVTCGSNHTFILLTNGELMSCGYNFYGQLGLRNNENINIFTKVIGVDKNIVEVVCGFDHTIIRLMNGRILGCGFNTCGKILSWVHSIGGWNYSFSDINKYSCNERTCTIS
ncbi:MAG: putative X-linked retinitis pigmentosa GTPase regulator-like [Hyperionvirus sp.]|uniref:Putative X-linked retinitis pigmentosa GTPase regulator-like n=1 Tax=Hyperionvirus sp. TaxID=2487770 RepID=A0A3G5A9R0_9VIRU|nr:MAG: putative X-linked retinitis pigmentosa GTPase regulator-like [Hyperionvirus sp.]